MKRMKEVTHCIVHKNCYDGFGSALAIWQRWPNAKFFHVTHTDVPPELPPDAEVVICDFSWPRPVIEGIRAKVKNLVVLDHHDSAERELAGLDYAHFDLNHSGAVLAWLWANPGEVIAPPFFQYLEDRDLWRFKLPGSREVAAWLQTYPYDFEVWNGFTKYGGMHTSIDEGRGILRGKEQMVEQMAANCVRIRLGGYDNIPVANAACYFSEVAEALCLKFPDAPFACYYLDRKDGHRQWGMRTLKKDVDISVVAKSMGGGGSRQAAGFTTGVPGLLGEVAQNEDLDQARVQLAGCLIAAEGTASMTPLSKEAFGWSPAYQATFDLRKKYDELLEKYDGAREQIRNYQERM